MLKIRQRAQSALRNFLRDEASGGIILMLAAALALIVANSPFADAYFHALKIDLMGMSALHWINDGLMALFFLLVGLEIKRELLDGQLSTWSHRALPGIAAVGGMAVPALIYITINAGSAETLRGWAIPAATDIAFALGVLSLLGSRVPVSLKLFLTALAILDDLGAVLIIALFYTSDLSLPYLGGAALAFVVLAVFNRFRIKSLAPYLVVGGLLWYCMLQSGVHATIAGVALALTIPLKASRAAPDDATSPLHRLEHALSPWVAFAIVPIFGFANAGVGLTHVAPAALFGPVPLGVATGLLVGKQIGVFGASWAAIKLGVAALPSGANWGQVYGVAVLCGIGFTMSLFIALLAFGAPQLQDDAKIGVLAGSIASALFGWLIFHMSSRGDYGGTATRRHT